MKDKREEKRREEKRREERRGEERRANGTSVFSLEHFFFYRFSVKIRNCNCYEEEERKEEERKEERK